MRREGWRDAALDASATQILFRTLLECAEILKSYSDLIRRDAQTRGRTY